MTLGRRLAPLLALALVGWIQATPGSALEANPPAAPPAPRISIITVGPGPLVWELFGHNMIRVTDPAAGTDLAYNFGMFDFRQEHFYWNFLQGRMLYAMAGYDARYELDRYARTGRSIEIQDLALTADQARTLATSLARNAEPDRRNYRYDYYRDNCSTRVRDALNLALGGAIERALAAIPTEATYRSRTAELTAGNPAVYFGLMLLLGPSTDRPLSAWEDSFIPMNFAHDLAPLVNPSLAGGTTPLVAAATMVPASGERAAPLPTPASWLGWFLVLGVVVGGTLAWAGARAGLGEKRFPFLVLAGLWSLLSGVAGALMLYLWAFTDHTVAYRNENVLQASVLGLVLFAMCAGWARRGGTAPAGLRVIAWTVAALSLAGVVLQLLPAFRQVNAPALVFFVPANVGMALGAARAAPPVTKTGRPAIPPSRPKSPAPA